MKSRFLPLLFLLAISFIFFYPVFLKGKLPIPSDTIVGLYHPYRDFYSTSFPNGIPFKNFLITDPVRQLYPWRKLSIEAFTQGNLPLWNPYSGSGSPLLANFQSGSFYPLNIFYLFFPFDFSWTFQIILQIFLSATFMYLYLRYLRLNKLACTLGALTFALSGFSIAWLEWNTVVQAVMWVPLLLFAKEKLLVEKRLRWVILLIFSECSIILAGHLQVAFYYLVIINIYLLVKVLHMARKGSGRRSFYDFFRIYKPFFLIGLIVVIITSIQWIPTLQLIFHSARNLDQSNWQKEGWFIPWQNLVQFIAPDFFGNPSTLNYSGIWNYAEFIGYIGIFPLLMALFALGFRRDKKTTFFGALFFLSLVFSLPTFFAKLPFSLSIPFISSAQPSRLLSITDFSLAILCALGVDMFISRKKKIVFPIIFLFLVLAGLWFIALYAFNILGMSSDQALVAGNNLKLPTVIFATAGFLFFLILFIKQKLIQNALLTLLVVLTIFDLFRFGWKFTPFTDASYLFPKTKILTFLQSDRSKFRLMTTDSRIFPPNFSSIYHLESVDQYDPLYLLRYGEFIASSERGEPNIDPPFGFNRILTPHNISSFLINLLNVKYVLSFTDIGSRRFEKVFQEGNTIVYKNNDVLPRIFFAEKIINAQDKHDAIRKVFSNSKHLTSEAIVEGLPHGNNQQALSLGNIELVKYSANEIYIRTKSEKESFLVLLDVNYPTWHAYISSSTGMIEAKIFQTNYLFRGIFIPKGEHVVKFQDHLL